ncbi:MAG: hypothetical protein KJO73_09135 [Croceitalea sp.]|nr:hypothetical protein [Croceitalea sp.]
MEKIQPIAEVLGYICVVVSLIASMTPTQKDDKFAGKMFGILHKIYKVLPTIGINPNTRVLEEKLKDK